MPQIAVNSTNIVNFGFSLNIDLYLKTMFFNTASLTTYQGGGAAAVPGISFRVEDQQGVVYKDYNFSPPDIIPDSTSDYTFDWSSFGLPFLLGNTLKITGAIKDQDGTVYYTTPVYKKICQPVDIQESGYVPGLFQIIADCPSNVLTVKELTLMVYDGKKPSSLTKSGTLYYPVGTGGTVAFTGTPFTNNVIYTGENRIDCTTVATYDIGDDINVLVTYLTRSAFPVTCNNKIMDLMCCLVDLENKAKRHCNTAIGDYARQQMADISFYVMVGLGKEINGQDASAEAEYIRKTLNCNCSGLSIGQNEQNPINPAVTSIVLNGIGGTSIPSPTINGNTKTFNIASNIYQVVKGNNADLAWSIVVDTSVTNTVKYKITFDYDVMAGYILTAIQNSPTYINLLNSLVTSTGSISLFGLDGKCIVDLSSNNYSVSQSVTGSTLITNIVINGTNYAAPANLFANNSVSVANWLNSITLGTFSAVISLGVLTIQSVANINVVSTITFTTPDIVKPFSATNKTLVQVLQAIVDYLCALTALQIALGNSLAIYYFDYNSNIVAFNFSAGNSQADFNAAIASSIGTIINRINNLTAITCAKIAAIFLDFPNSFLTSAGRVYGNDGASCVAWTIKQLANAVILAVNSYPDVKTAFCAIDCTAPGSCPDVSDISIAPVGANTIGLYGVTWNTPPNATQTVTVRYKLTSSTTWLVATNSLQVLANGNLVGTTPFSITGLVAGSTYDVQVVNDCGGAGFSKQITVPTGSVYSGAFIFHASIYSVCAAAATTLYSSSPFAIGVIMYQNPGLTVPLTGSNFIAGTDGEIFTIDSATGEVLADTGSNCATGTPGTYILGNSTVTICGSGTGTTYYTNGAFAVGGILYTDSGLTSPATGFSFVVRGSNGHIYNLNSATGQIGSDTGITCGSFGRKLVLSNLDNISCVDPFTVYYSNVPFGVGAFLYTNPGLTTPVTGFLFVLDSLTGNVYNLNSVTGQVGSLDTTCSA